MFADWCGKLGAIISLLAYLPFVVAILRREARPSRASWIIWEVVNVGVCFSYAASGAKETLFVPIAYSIGSFVIAVLSFKYGDGGWRVLDRFCFIAALVGISFWWIFDSPAMTLFAEITVDCVAGIPTIIKARREPESEDRLTWALFLMGAMLNICAIKSPEFIIAAYPVAIFFLIASIAFLVWKPRLAHLTGW